jgi:hypothetical protein
MREQFDMMAFVNAVYALTFVCVTALVVWSWLSMRNAERTRDRARGK